MLYNKRIIRLTAKAMLMTLAFQLVWPAASFALTSGPSQPEVQSFEPVGTTDMVDMFTGDFVYNIPLLDVEGYPVNISYHGGIDMEQEASWVGLGWNINPGVINRSVRGMPDDFKGEEIKKELHIKEERNFRIGTSTGAEVGGVSPPILNLSLGIGGMINMSNYRGVSVDMSASGGISVFGMVSAGVNMGIGSQTGADIDYNAGVSFGSSSVISADVAGGLGLNMSHGYNTRTGLKDRSFSLSSNVNMGGRNLRGPSYQTTVPIGVKNIIPVITNSTTMTALYGQIKLGGELAWTYGYGAVSAMISQLSYKPDGTKKGYGYLYADKATENDILDFTRDRDGMFNKSMGFLPPGNMTYDVYSVAGQGTGGSFRPFRNDFGTVYDPVTSSRGGSGSVSIDGGVGWNFEFGIDLHSTTTLSTSGPWDIYKKAFRGNKAGSVYESSYFKQAGELTAVNSSYLDKIGGKKPAGRSLAGSLSGIKPGSDSRRDPRANLIYYFTAKEASVYGVASSQKIYSYKSTDGFAAGPVVPKDSFSRTGGVRKEHQISEVVQVQTNGQRYIYGIPAMNNVQREVTFSVDAPTDPALKAKGLVTYTSKEDSTGNDRGIDNYYSASITPAYAHSYLLTSVLSTDYVDITGDGPTDDDFGSYTKFNYTLKDADYRWRAPMTQNEDQAQYNPGFRTDPDDDKGSYLAGSREQWILHSIETKNFVAEFYTSGRADGKGGKKAIKGTGYTALSTAGESYKLDSIKLFNKHDRFINMTAAVPVKTVFFKYHDPTDNLSLCKGITNGDSNAGKLTLERIYVRYGNSEKSMLSPYRFEYSSKNPGYNPADKDRWGAYKPSNAAFPNSDFPFVSQEDPDLDANAGAWSLTKIHLPSGGTIETTYEADDYAYVQDKPAMEMFKLEGVGLSQVFMPLNQLFISPLMPSSYFYFKRRPADEQAGVSMRDIYLKDQECIYYNIETWLAGNSFEPVKGYAQIEDVGVCTNNSTYGYVRVKPVSVKGGSANLNPAAYTAINFGRYHLPHIIFDGYQKDVSDIEKVLSGLKQAFDELVNMGRNPVARLAERNVAKEVNLGRSYIRLTNPAKRKKGGGHRVKRLAFYDNWSALAGGQEHTAAYGKDYDYTTEEGGRKISSGVASYEPQIGGDENPFRVPVQYTAQSGSRWPPNDPVSLYQEMPVGESLYPAPVVGYSKVTVSSIHREQGRSSQGVDIHQFYTAADFPLEVLHSPLEQMNREESFAFKTQRQIFQAAQGYTIVLNDMHGKPKRTENRIMKPGGRSELVSYQDYRYNAQGKKLNNTVPVLEYEPVTGKMKRVSRQLGVEADVTIDSREKKEHTTTDNFYFNLNTSAAVIVPIPVPLPMPWGGDYLNQFNSVVTTKMIQQYGILMEVESYKEGAVTKVRNEVFDPLTGQALITSVNNEYQDKEYNVIYPAYWGYKAMGPAYENVAFEEAFPFLTSDPQGVKLPTALLTHIKPEDELLLSYRYGGQQYECKGRLGLVAGCNAQVQQTDTTQYGYCDTIPMNGTDTCIYYCAVYLHPLSSLVNWPQPSLNPDTIWNVRVKVTRSYAKNQLDDNIQSYASLMAPIDGNDYLKDTISQVIRVSANSFGALDYSGINRLYQEYVYLKDRNYSSAQIRREGTFFANLIWKGIKWSDLCGAVNSKFFASYFGLFPDDKNWQIARTITKRSPQGFEVENKDAIGNYAMAVLGYNDNLPVALVQNARQQEAMVENFEDYSLLQAGGTSIFSPFRKYFSLTAIGGSSYNRYVLTGSSNLSITDQAAHTGKYSLKTSTLPSLSIPISSIDCYYREYQPFLIQRNKEFIVSYWFRPITRTGNEQTYSSIPPDTKHKSNIIEGWQQLERTFKVTNTGTYELPLPADAYIDDIRIYPVDANMKSFVYHPFSQKLIAALDENNFATFYEYDQEGNLVRTKKETERGIITLSESRSGTTKK